jgi:peptide/nickel transport system substrate-binding protein
MGYRWFRNSRLLLLSPLFMLLIFVIGCGGQPAATAPAAAPAATTAPAAAAVAATPAPVSTSQSPASSAAATDAPVPAATTAPQPIVADTGKVGGVLRTQVFGFPAQTFTPHVNWQAFVFAGGAWSLLVEFDPTTPDPFDIRPDLAKSWEISEDGLTYTFALHDNVKYHDGTPVTADDVVYSMDRMTRLRGSTRSPLKTYYEEGNTQAIDQNTVAITTKFPTQDLLAVLGMNSSYIVSEAWQTSVEEGQTDEQLGQPFDKVMGSGPFKSGETVRDVSIEVVRNEDYFKDGFPLLDAVKHVVIIEKGTIIAAYKTGQVLMSSYPLTNLTTREALTLDQETPDVTAYFTPPNNTFPIRFNHRRAPFDDPRVRQAFNLAFHRQAIRDVVGHPDVGAVAPPITGIMAAGPWGRTEEEISQLPGYRELNGEKHPDDIAAAKKLLADAGYPNGFETTFLATPIERPGVVPLFTDQLKEFLNVTLVTETVDLATMARRIDARDMDIWVDTSPPLIVAPDNWLWQAYMPLTGTVRASGWDVPQAFQDAVQAQAQEQDPEKRLVMIREIENFLMTEDPGPWIVMFWEARQVIVNDRVKGFNMPALAISQLKFEHIWCDPC